MNIPKTHAWQALAEHYPAIENHPMRDLFNEEPERCSRFSIEDQLLFLDYSKNRITAETVRLLIALALEANLAEAIEQMFQGERINFTEQRAVLHTALRSQTDRPILVDGEDLLQTDARGARCLDRSL